MDIKADLPDGWVVSTSKQYPNRIYYFNTKSKKSSWEFPIDDMQNAGTSKSKNMGNKRKSVSEDSALRQRPCTPDLEPSKKPKGSNRRTLRAKRRVAPVENDEPTQNDESVQNTSGSKMNETPQMQAIRAQMLARRAKGNAPKRSTATSINPPEKETEKVPEETVSNVGRTTEDQTLTPQMRVLVDKLKHRQSQGGSSKNPTRKSMVPIETKVVPVQSPRRSSVLSVETVINAKVASRRRSSRKKVNDSKDVDDQSISSYSIDLIRDDSINVHTTKSSTSKKRVMSPNKQDIDIPSSTKSKKRRLGRSAILKKNLAAERLARLQQSFTESQLEISGSSENPEVSECDEIHHPVDLMTSNEKPASPPSIYKNAKVRSKFLQEHMYNKAQSDKRMRTLLSEGTIHNSKEESMIIPSPVTDDFCEEMEWEPIEEEKMMQEVQVVRAHISQLGTFINHDEIPHMSLDCPDGPSKEHQKPSLYIVIDTNVFLSNIAAIEEARDAVFKTYGPPLIVIPWTVLRELDFIKGDKSMMRPEPLRAKARQAVRFIYQHFSARHPRILGQIPSDVTSNRQRFDGNCPDDEILQTCLQIRSSNNCVVLLSYDKNLCNKAMFHDIVSIGRHDPLEKVDYLQASDVKNDSFLALRLRGEEEDPALVPIYQKELRMAATILEEAKEVLTSFLTVIVTKEMQNLYNENWERYTLIRPPWTVTNVLKCAIKHWIATVSDSFTRRAEPLLRQLSQAMNNIPDSGAKFSDVNHILDTISDLLQCTRVEKHSSLVTRSSLVIADLRTKCVEAMKQITMEKLHGEYGSNNKTIEEEAAANRAFKQFEEVYEFVRDMGGLLSNSIGMPCSISYKPLNIDLPIEGVKEMQPEVAADLNRLLQVLSTALKEISDLHVNHKAVGALYNALATLIPKQQAQIEQDFSPLDVYYCIKRKEKLLRMGLNQLEELSAHYCRMATFRCT